MANQRIGEYRKTGLNRITKAVRADSAGCCFACAREGGELVAKRLRGHDGGAVKVGRWTYGLYHRDCEPPADLRPPDRP